MNNAAIELINTEIGKLNTRIAYRQDSIDIAKAEIAKEQSIIEELTTKRDALLGALEE